MNDTAPQFTAMVAERHRAMSPVERLQAASDMFGTARAIVESSLPAGLSRRDRRMALICRLHGDELPKAALEAFADWQGTDE